MRQTPTPGTLMVPCYTQGMDNPNFTEGMFTACFWADCSKCEYRFPVRAVLSGVSGFRCPNCTSTDVDLDFEQGDIPAEIFEVWEPGVLSRQEKRNLRKLRSRIEGQIDFG